MKSSSSNPTAFVTGATGFLGNHLVRALVAKNFAVTVLARKSSSLASLQGLPVTLHYGDITDTLALLEGTQHKDYVFHLAGLIAYKKSQRSAMEKVNVQGTRNVIDACITNRVGKILYLSSVAAIGASRRPVALHEDSPFNLAPYNLGYFETKRAAEEIVLSAVEEHDLPAYIINPSTIYGAGDATKGSRKTQLKVARGEFKFYTPGGVNVVYVNDVIKIIFAALEKGRPGRRYIAAGENLTIRQLFATIAEAAGVPPPVVPLPGLALTMLGYVGDVLTKLGRETSLSSETAVTSQLFHWFENQRVKDELAVTPQPAKVAIYESVSWMKENGLLNFSKG